ncbi:thiol:disulfide interchange protein [Mycobacterium sp. 1245111.1]|uniref:cytochrome c biogenesis protein DipZ n=1 Tax=Mycobacterium sp. 1245111.1 TaxID=1834073 RepID=UPI0007FEBE50|nr:cytochrome c biogenesis protein DipZ [Mycobacterium sp. 1245111.1]OBK34890.1 thiol:disulfide interchange protein [Mycobacterium sp. 1245111.1]
MVSLALIGLIGGLITGISPCILPVLPVIFFSGTTNAGGGSVAVDTKRDVSRPYRVIAGLVLSFSLVTLVGSAVLSLLHLPQDAIRWVALVALLAIGLGLIFPGVEELLEKPFARIPQKRIMRHANGFGLGLALGVLYVPCAGPVLAAIVVAGATAQIGLPIIVLTLTFAVGTAIPLLFFAVAGERITNRISAFRRRQRVIRLAAGVVTILLAVALVFNVPATLQRAIPDYTGSLQDKLAHDKEVQQQLGGIVNDQNKELSNCAKLSEQLQNCGQAPDLQGIVAWLGTPGNQPVDLHALRGKVVLIDFWAYSCINCQRAIPHVEGWYKAYHDAGFDVIGVHTPEYAFEKVTENVKKGAADLGITYPIAQDNNYSTWTNYRNRYWPAEYLIDANGVVRHVKFGEGDYDGTEKLIRRLLTTAQPGISLPPPVEAPDTTPTADLTPETYFGVGKMSNYAGVGTYDQGRATFAYPPTLPADTFALQGPWALDYQGATADGDGSSIRLNYHAKNVYIVVGGAGSLSVTRAGKTTTLPISGPPTSHEIAAANDVGPGSLDIGVSKGLQVFSFTYG